MICLEESLSRLANDPLPLTLKELVNTLSGISTSIVALEILRERFPKTIIKIADRLTVPHDFRSIIVTDEFIDGVIDEEEVTKETRYQVEKKVYLQILESEDSLKEFVDIAFYNGSVSTGMVSALMELSSIDWKYIRKLCSSAEVARSVLLDLVVYFWDELCEVGEIENYLRDILSKSNGHQMILLDVLMGNRIKAIIPNWSNQTYLISEIYNIGPESLSQIVFMGVLKRREFVRQTNIFLKTIRSKVRLVKPDLW